MGGRTGMVGTILSMIPGKRSRVRRTTLDRFIRMLQDAHAGELAAAYAYRGHARSLRHGPIRTEITRIEGAEWHHRALVGAMMTEHGARPRRRREFLMAAIGRFFGALCFIPPRVGPMYAAGRLEASNVRQYVQARDWALELGYGDYEVGFDEMIAEEARHETFFAEQSAPSRLVPIARALLGWDPRAALADQRSTVGREGRTDLIGEGR